MPGIIPKSNAKLKYGDFCLIRRDDGMPAVFVWLCPQGNTRSFFYGAVCKQLVKTTDIGQLPASFEIDDHPLVYIKVFLQHNLEIVGNIAKLLPIDLLADVTAKINDNTVGAKHRVCGINAVIKWANEIAT